MGKASALVLAAVHAFGLFSVASAHPLDVSATSLTVSGKSLSLVTALHPAEVERILWKNGLSMRSLTYGDYYANEGYVFEYLRDAVSVSSAGVPCAARDFRSGERTVDEIFSEGFPVSYSFDCGSPVSDFSIRVRIFDEIPLQTNRLTVFDSTGKTLAYKVLTPVLPDFSYDSSKGQARWSDADGDGLPDEEERAYRTDASNSDTDGDYYTDGEEVSSWWNPLSKDLSPGQKYRESPIASDVSGETSRTDDGFQKRFEASATLLDSSTYWADFFRNVLKRVAEFASVPDAGDFWALFLLTVVLWFVHAAWPGHAKSLLAASVLDRRRGFLSWLSFAVVFTVTHLADVAILVLLTKFVFNAFDPGPYMAMIQKAWALWLVAVAAYLCYEAFVTAKRPAADSSRAWNFRQAPGWRDVFSGFFAWLAPCAFGWGIFLVLFSLGKTAWALPLLFALGIGIFLCLFCVLSITYFLREKAFVFAPKTLGYSQAVSAVFVSFVAVYAVSAVW